MQIFRKKRLLQTKNITSDNHFVINLKVILLLLFNNIFSCLKKTIDFF